MGDMGEYWRDVKEHYRGKQKRYEDKIAPVMSILIGRAREVGDQWRIGEWDFWTTGTVRNYKTGERISVQELERITRPKVAPNTLKEQ